MSPVLALVAVGAMVRGGMIATYAHRLMDDPDAYRAIAESLAAGNGFSARRGKPTAYRPPLYPLALAPLFGLQEHRWAAIGGLHVVLGAASVWLTYWIARRLRLGWGSYAAAGLLALDPLSVYHASVVMSETLFTFVLLLAAAAFLKTADAQDLRWAAAAGGAFGLAALCRPTTWATLAVLAAWNALRRGRWAELPGGRLEEKGQAWPRTPVTAALESAVLCAVALLVALPWAIRNWRVFGEPIITTTHGGYTLALGNNRYYYNDPLDPSWGEDGAVVATRKGSPFADWQRETSQQAAGGNEVQRDRYFRRAAIRAMLDDPGAFALSCLLREVHFWRPVPRGGYPGWAKAGSAGFYGVVYVLFVVGLIRRETWRAPTVVLVLLIGSFMLVHLVYWTDMRMRTPVMPAVAMIAAAAAEQMWARWRKRARGASASEGVTR